MEEGSALRRDIFPGAIARHKMLPRFFMNGAFFMNDEIIMMEQKRRGVRLSNLQRLMIIPLSILALFVIWKMAVRITKFPPFILPPPGLVWNKFVTVLSDGSLVRHLWVTLIEVLVGLTVGVAFATILGYFLAKSRLVERLLSPYIVASQSVPIVAI